jgi:outer membrane protein TolC
MTLGPAIVFLAWADRLRLSERHPLPVFGRVPLFYYLLHIPVAHALAIALTWLEYGGAPFLFLPPPTLGTPRNLFPPDHGWDLWVVYVVWIVVVLALHLRSGTYEPQGLTDNAAGNRRGMMIDVHSSDEHRSTLRRPRRPPTGALVALAAALATPASLAAQAPALAPAGGRGPGMPGGFAQQAGQAAAQAGETIDLTLERMVELGLRDSFRVRQLQLEVERTRSLLRAEQAGLKSRVELNLSTPEFQKITDTKWNSTLQRNELIGENTRRWQMDLSIRQPVILFGYPTNGYLSLNNRVYRYTQIESGSNVVQYYNRYFIAYDQPLFQPNRMKNNLENARLDVERSELDYQNDVIGMIDDLASEYYELLEQAYRREMESEFVGHLEQAAATAADVVAADASRAIEADQVQVELANAREDYNQAGSNMRLREENIKQRLRLPASTSLVVKPDLRITPVAVDVDQAIRLASTLAPRLRQLDIGVRKSEIQLDETRGNNAFRMNIGVTYGREVEDPLFSNLWRDPRNSYTVNVRATVPIWDWGQRQHRIQAQEYAVERSELAIEEAQTQIETNVRNQVRSLDEYAARLTNMQQNLELAHRLTGSTLERYRRGDVTLTDMLQAIGREASTAQNFLNAFMGYQRALLRLQELTYYDFERGMPLVERFSVRAQGEPDQQ